MNYAIHLCGPFLSVPGETECREAIGTEMRACRKCDHSTCYRKGWSKAKAGADNTCRIKTGWKEESPAPAPERIMAMRFVCHVCGSTTERMWKNIQRRWPRCCKALMSETAIATKAK